VRVTPEHLQVMRERIAAVEAALGDEFEVHRQRYRDREIPNGDLVKDIDRRWRWDLYWAAARLAGSMPDSTDGYDDAHIDTALRSIVTPL
jgi:hypothetical protein